MRTPENVIYTDNGNAPVSKLVGTACSIAIQYSPVAIIRR